MLKASSMQGDAAQAALQPHDARSTSHTRSKSLLRLIHDLTLTRPQEEKSDSFSTDWRV